MFFFHSFVFFFFLCSVFFYFVPVVTGCFVLFVSLCVLRGTKTAVLLYGGDVSNHSIRLCCSFLLVGMEEEVQQLKELVSQLRADNERLRQEQAAPTGGPGGASSSAFSSPTPSAGGAAAAVTERLVVIPRDRKCPVFNGRTGIGITDWVEEVQACMRARHLSAADQALFIFDHLEGEAKEEIKFRSAAERGDPVRVVAILQELYGCVQSYVTLQQAFFSRHQLEGETLQEFSLALMALMARVRQCAPGGMPNAEVLLRDQFIEHVLDCSLRRELKQFVRRQPTATLLELRSEAIRWEREGLPGGARGRSASLPSAYGLQYGVQGCVQPTPNNTSPKSDLNELMGLLKHQQEQLDRLTQTVASLQAPRSQGRRPRDGPLICRRCQQPGHFARECDNERASSRHRAHSVAGLNSNVAERASPSHLSENLSPLNC